MTANDSILYTIILPIAGAFAFAFLVHRAARRFARRFVPLGRLALGRGEPRLERQQTVQGLIASAISFGVFTLAGLFTLGRFVDTTTLVWMIGLFSAGVGLGARPFISDYLSGISFLFEDTFDVGDKIEVLGPANIEGVVEVVNLRITLMRGMEGELFIIPNGEIRAIRNFSRGRFSATNVTLKVPAASLEPALELLESLGGDAMSLLPNLLEPWKVISPTGAIGPEAELTIFAKARFGKGAEMRPRMQSLIQQRLAENGIDLVG